MTETGWQVIGRLAKSRRERLGLRQDELAQYGGPKVSTVGKFERAAGPFPLRTQHQMEKALGWSRTTIEQVVSWVEEHGNADEWEHDLVEEEVPDMARPLTPGSEDPEDADLRMRALERRVALLEDWREEREARDRSAAAIKVPEVGPADQPTRFRRAQGYDALREDGPDVPVIVAANEDDELSIEAEQEAEHTT